MFGQQCDLVKNVFRKISLGYRSVTPEVITGSSRAGGRWDPERYGRQRYRGEGKETEVQQRSRREGDRGKKAGETWRGVRWRTDEMEMYVEEQGRGETYDRCGGEQRWSTDTWKRWSGS